jgi:hypothetical protein
MMAITLVWIVAALIVGLALLGLRELLREIAVAFSGRAISR